MIFSKKKNRTCSVSLLATTTFTPCRHPSAARSTERSDTRHFKASCTRYTCPTTRCARWAFLLFIFSCFRSLLMPYWVYFDTFFLALYLSNNGMQQVQNMMEYIHILEDHNIISYMTYITHHYHLAGARYMLRFVLRCRCKIHVEIYVKMQVQDTC